MEAYSEMHESYTPEGMVLKLKVKVSKVGEKQICKMYFGENNYSPTKYQSDLSDEIVYNANVASNKYKIFRLAVLLDIVAFAALVFFIIMA